MLEQKILKANGTEGFFVTFYSMGFIFLSYVLVKAFLEHSSILKISAVFIWIIVCIAQIYFQSKKLLISQSENTLDNQDQYQGSTRVKQLAGVITGLILGILLTRNVDFFNTKTQFVVQPEYEPFLDYSNIVLGIAYVTDDLMKLFNIKKSLSRSILSLFKIMLFISGVFMYFVYTVHLTEVNL
ncbi:MAG: hypothetical protein ACRC80_25395 [Waterburya sp.]